MSNGGNIATSKLPKPSDSPGFGKTEHVHGRPVGSVAARAQAWERCPNSGFVTIGSVRYGVRVSTCDVAPPRAVAGKLCDEFDCCCATTPSRIPLLPRAKNTHQAPVIDGPRDMKAAPPTPSSLRRRFLVKFGGAASSGDADTNRLLPHDDSHDETTGAAAATSPGQSALDKLQKFRFGSSEDKNVKKKRGSDKTEKLRELTDMLRGRPDKRKPPTSPPCRTSKHQGLRSLFGSTSSLTGPSKESTPTKTSHKRASSVSNVAASNHPPPKPVVPAPPDPPPEEPSKKPEPKPLPPLASRPFASRSASFSQVDYNSSDGKYSWKRGGHSKAEHGGSKALTFPRKTQVDAATSVSPPPERVLEETTSSTPSVDSAVGSDEGFGLGSSQCLSEPHKPAGARSLTYPLGRKGTYSDDIPFSSIDGNGMKSLQSPHRELSDVKEEVIPDGFCLDTASGSPSSLSTVREVDNISLLSGHQISESDSPGENERTFNIKSPSEEMLKPLENLGKEIDDLLIREKSSPKKPEIFITTWPRSDRFDNGSDESPQAQKKKLTLNCDLQPRSNDDDDISQQRWSAGTDYSQATGEWSSEPMSPDDAGQKPKLFSQSSDEKDEEGSPPKRNISRNESLSDGESDPAERSPSVPTSRDGERTCSPSPLFSPLFDLSDNENKTSKRPNHPPRRYSKRPLRGPYGQMLEAEMKKPESKAKREEDLKFLENFITVQPSSPEAEMRLSASPRPRANTARSLDDFHMRRGQSGNPRSSPKRKVSANIPYSTSDPSPTVYHQRTTSSPSQLGVCSVDNPPQKPPQTSPEVSQQLLAELLKGSSEQRFSPDTSPGHSPCSKVADIGQAGEEAEQSLTELSTQVMNYTMLNALGPREATELLRIQNKIFDNFNFLEENTRKLFFLMLGTSGITKPPAHLALESSDEDEDIPEGDKVNVDDAVVDLNEAVDEYGLRPQDRRGLSLFRKNLQDNYMVLLNELNEAKEALEEAKGRNLDLYRKVERENEEPMYEWKLRMTAKLPKSISTPNINENPEGAKPTETTKPSTGRCTCRK